MCQKVTNVPERDKAEGFKPRLMQRGWAEVEVKLEVEKKDVLRVERQVLRGTVVRSIVAG